MAKAPNEAPKIDLTCKKKVYEMTFYERNPEVKPPRNLRLTPVMTVNHPKPEGFTSHLMELLQKYYDPVKIALELSANEMHIYLITGIDEMPQPPTP